LTRHDAAARILFQEDKLMPKLVTLLPTICVVMFVGGCGDSATNSERQEITRVWNRYREALVARDGAAAAALMTESTFKFYDRQLRLALFADKQELGRADTLDRFAVLLYRARLSPEQLEKMDGQQLFHMAVDSGWVGSDLNIEVKVNRVAGDTAHVHFVKDEKEISSNVALLKRENGVWKIDLNELMLMSRPALLKSFDRVAEQSKSSVNDAIVMTIEKITGKTLDDDIWLPPRPAKQQK
jgi:hypothetical protein